MALGSRLRRPALRVFGRLPRSVRRTAVRTATTTYTLGCLAVLQRGDDVLLLEQAHLSGLSLPGGLLRRGETPRECVRREVREELGVDLPVGEQPDGVVVDARARRVDLVFRAQLEDEPQADQDAEVERLRWLPPAAAARTPVTARALAAVLPPAALGDPDVR